MEKWAERIQGCVYYKSCTPLTLVLPLSGVVYLFDHGSPRTLFFMIDTPKHLLLLPCLLSIRWEEYRFQALAVF